MDAMTYNRLEEGERLSCYDDATGKTLAAGDVPVGTPTISVGVTGPDVVPGLTINQARSDELYAQRWLVAQGDASQCVGAAVYTALDEVRRAAITSMAYNLGVTRLKKFVGMLAAIRVGAWNTAAQQCLDSLAARQLPARYGRLAEMYRTGEWQPGYGA